MPQEKSIGVSKETLEMLKAYQDEFGFSSLDQSIENSVRWARLFNYIDSEQRRTVQERLVHLELQIGNLETLREKDLIVLRDQWERLKALEAKIKN